MSVHVCLPTNWQTPLHHGWIHRGHSISWINCRGFIVVLFCLCFFRISHKSTDSEEEVPKNVHSPLKKSLICHFTKEKSRAH